MSHAFCSLFNSGGSIELKKSALLTVEYQTPENLVFQHIPVKEKIINPYKNKRLEEISRMRNGVFKRDTLTDFDIVAIVKREGVVLEFSERLVCHNLIYNLFTEIVTDMFETRDIFNSQGKDLLQNPAKKIGLSV